VSSVCAAGPISRLAPLANLIERFQQRTPIRAHSLVVTLYGDVIEPRGGSIWLGSLIDLLAPLGLNERLIRTSIFRLGKEGWLSAQRVGRRSYYRLTEPGRRRFETASRRVYSSELPGWDGTWCLLLLTQLSSEKRKQLREELQWQGFAAFSPTLLASPRGELSDLAVTLRELGVGNECIIFQTCAQVLTDPHTLHHQVRESWNLDVLGEHYHAFIQAFRPLWQVMGKNRNITPEDAFLSRILLIHEYRRLLLRDPQLPDELLPAEWEGRAARQLCRDLYHLVYARAEQWLDEAVGANWSPSGAPRTPNRLSGELRFGV